MGPAVLELKKEGIAGPEVERGRERAPGGLCRASSGRQGEAAPDCIEVGAVVQNQGKLVTVAEWSSSGMVQKEAMSFILQADRTWNRSKAVRPTVESRAA